MNAPAHLAVSHAVSAALESCPGYPQVIVDSRRAVVIWVWPWPGKHYARIRFLDTNERTTVNVSDIKAEPQIETMPETFACRGCGCDLNGEYDLCRACDREQQAESAEDARRDR